MFPTSNDPLLVRTDFSDDAAWASLRSVVETPDPQCGFLANLTVVDDRAHDGADVDTLLALLPSDHDAAILCVVDQRASSEADHPILVVDLVGERGRNFRCAAAALWGVENNLSIANMDWEDFADNVDADGVHRGVED